MLSQVKVALLLRVVTNLHAMQRAMIALRHRMSELKAPALTNETGGLFLATILDPRTKLLKEVGRTALYAIVDTQGIKLGEPLPGLLVSTAEATPAIAHHETIFAAFLDRVTRNAPDVVRGNAVEHQDNSAQANTWSSIRSTLTKCDTRVRWRNAQMTIPRP